MLFLLVYRNHFFVRFSSIVRVIWSHALAPDLIRDILWLQFVQKTRGVDVLFPPFLGRRRFLSRKGMMDAVPSLSVGIIFFFDSPHQVQNYNQG